MAVNDDRRFGVTITNREIYDQVLATKDVLNKLVDKVEAVEKRDSDHEARMRALEQWRWKLAGILTFVSAAASAIVSAVMGA